MKIKNINNSMDLTGEWISSFIQNNRISNEKVIFKQEGNYYLVFYKPDNCQITKENIKDIKMVSYNTRLFLRLILPYIREWSDNHFCEHLTSKRDYERICKIEDLL